MTPYEEPVEDLYRETMPESYYRCPVHHIPDCSPLLNGCSLVNEHYDIEANKDDPEWMADA